MIEVAHMSEREELKAVVVVWSDAFDGPGGWVDPPNYHWFCPR